MTVVKMNDFSSIQTEEDLQAAINSVRSRLSDQAHVVSQKYHGLRSHYAPVNIIAGFVNRSSGYFNWASLSLSLIKYLKGKVSGFQPFANHPDR
jgi:hypothetical protein